MSRSFSLDCRSCDRLASFLDEVRTRHPDYHARPVPSFGAADAQLLIVGLAPGMHGANATGRPFTGDYAGLLLYRTLFDFAFASAPESLSAGDGLQLRNCRITNAVRCLPPQNKPTTGEVDNCNAYLQAEIRSATPPKVVLALGGVAHRAVLKALGVRLSAYPFGHAGWHEPAGVTLVDSYHCSRYTTQTRRLTEAMFRDVFERIRLHLDG
jgi:uracil-DNA glycosylase family 4